MKAGGTGVTISQERLLGEQCRQQDQVLGVKKQWDVRDWSSYPHHPTVLQLPTFQELLEPFPKVQGWMSRVAETTSPHWTALTAPLQKVAKRGRDKRQQAAASSL